MLGIVRMTTVFSPPSPLKKIVLIGAGPAGYVSAIRLAQLGFEVTVVDEAQLGGTCLNWGCIPSKALIHASTDYYKLKKATQLNELGIYAENVRFDWKTLATALQGTVSNLRSGIDARLKRLGVLSIHGSARFVSPTTLEITKADKSTETLTADAFVIAAGAETFIPPVFENQPNEFVFSVKTFFNQPELPKRLAIVGAGVIGLELAQAMNRLGVEVHVIDRLPDLLKQYDSKHVETLKRLLSEEGIAFHFNANVTACVVNESQKEVDLTIQPLDAEITEGKLPERLVVDGVLVAPGRRANTHRLGLTEAGIRCHEQSGGVLVNTYLQTNQPHIFAIGDVVHGTMQLAHVASHHGIVLAETLAGKRLGLDSATQTPAVIYTQPELARVGYGLEEAKEQGFQAKLTRLPFAVLGRASIEDASQGSVLIVVDEKTQAVLGAEIMSPHADILIAQVVQAIEMGATVQDIALTIHPHPSLSEAWLEVAERHMGHGIHI
jgi:dihydrolipoamide dehydrogenase